MLYDDVCVRPKTLIFYDYGLGCKAYITCWPQSRWTIMRRTDKYVRLANGNVSIELALEDFEKNWIDMAIKALEQQSEDVISRQAALDIYDDYNVAVENGELEAYRKHRKRLLKLPPVQPKPRVGHWIYDKRIENWKCSECGCSPKTIGYVGRVEFMREHFKFCNHCGAKMADAIMGEK